MQRRHRLSGLLAALAALTVVATSACTDPPDVVLAQAWDAAELEETDRFILAFTPASGEVLRGLAAVKTRTLGDMNYLADPFEVLPRGEITEVKQRDNLALVTVKAKGEVFDVKMLRERGMWLIDGFALPTFWRPLTSKDQT